MKYLVKNGDINPFNVDSTFYLFSRKFNAVFEIDEGQYYYLRQEFNNFKTNEIIENSFNKKFETIPISIGQRNLVLATDIRKKTSFPLILKNILDLYNFYNKIIITIDLNYDSLYVIENILKWINGYERIIIVCRISKEDDDVSDNFKLYLTEFKKKYSIKIFEEIFYTVFQLEKKSQKTEPFIKINPFLASKQLDELELEQIAFALLDSKSSKSFKYSLESGMKLRPADIMYVSDNEVIVTSDKNDVKCNKCWAKNTCFSNSFYSIFSSHPYVCSINEQNCKIILSTVDQIIKSSLNNWDNNFNNKLINREISIGDYSLKHLNP